MDTLDSHHSLPVLALNAAAIVDAVMREDRRVLLFGPVGSGKSTLLTRLADALVKAGRSCRCINADPGSPLFGPPGSVAWAIRQQGAWQVADHMALCSLDAGRFRLPLISAFSALQAQIPEGMLMIDAPGVVRGVAGGELLHSLVEAARVDAVLVLSDAVDTPPLPDELRALSVEVFMVPASADASRPGKRARARQRTAQWNAYLGEAIEQSFDITAINIIGTPPPLQEIHSWIGRQVALLRGNQTLAMGEVRRYADNILTLALPDRIDGAANVLIRDAQRSTNGWLETAPPYAAERFDYVPPADVLPSVESSDGPRVVGRVGGVDVALVNGVFGDPLLHMRVRHQRRSLLFDLGEGSRLPARIAHQVTDVFLTHAHMDHVGGFLWLLRSRIGDYPPCRLYGPPGLAQHISGFINGVLWDRIADRGPVFDVMEFHGDRLKCFRLQAGYMADQALDDIAIVDGILASETGYRIRGVLLDHRGTSVVSYAYEPDMQINIRKDRLAARGLQPGHWLNELKQQLLGNNDSAMIRLPDGTLASVAELAEDLVMIMPGKKFVYATDLADTRDNRQRLIHLAQTAHTLFCESAFTEADADHALRNGHLTTRACGEIATAANVSRLVPFHFSRRYLREPQQIYDEIRRFCNRVLMPVSMAVFDTATDTDRQGVLELDNRV